MKTIILEEKGTRIERVLNRNLSHSASGIKLSGQLLSLRSVPCTRYSNASVTSQDPDSLDTPYSWIWDGTFGQLAPSGKQSAPSSTSKASRKTLVIRLPSHVCEPVSPHIIDVKDRLPLQELPSLNVSGLTWELTDAELTILTAKFPYPDSEGKPTFNCEEASLQLAAASQKLSDDKFRCYQCLAVMDRRLARNHVGGHILKAIRHVGEELAGIPVGSEMPCGFCGRSGVPMCSQLYLTAQAGRSPQARSECPHYCAFQYKSSLNSTHTMPCTNTPVLCPVPGCTQSIPGKLLTAVWKYNMPQHVRTHHPGYSVDGFEDGTLLPDLLRIMDITCEEEKALGIPESAIPTLKRTDILSASAPGQSTTGVTDSSTPASRGSAGRKRPSEPRFGTQGKRVRRST